jgi:hypothetical protein
VVDGMGEDGRSGERGPDDGVDDQCHVCVGTDLAATACAFEEVVDAGVLLCGDVAAEEARQLRVRGQLPVLAGPAVP